MNLQPRIPETVPGTVALERLLWFHVQEASPKLSLSKEWSWMPGVHPFFNFCESTGLASSAPGVLHVDGSATFEARVETINLIFSQFLHPNAFTEAPTSNLCLW